MCQCVSVYLWVCVYEYVSVSECVRTTSTWSSKCSTSSPPAAVCSVLSGITRPPPCPDDPPPPSPSLRGANLRLLTAAHWAPLLRTLPVLLRCPCSLNCLLSPGDDILFLFSPQSVHQNCSSGRERAGPVSRDPAARSSRRWWGGSVYKKI